MSNVQRVQRNRAIKHLAGPISRDTLWVLIVFFILVEFLVVPSFSFIDELWKKFPLLNDSNILRSIVELMCVTLVIMFTFSFAKKRIEEWGESLPLSVDEKIITEHSVVASSLPISLVIGLSNAFHKLDNEIVSDRLWKADLKELARLNEHKFAQTWNKSVYKNHNWRQPLFCINHFLKKGRRIDLYIFCSSESRNELEHFSRIVSHLYKGELLQIKSFTKLLSEKTGNNVEEKGIDFNNLKDISYYLDEAVRFLESSFDKSEIVLDVTSGTKLVSVASAIVSFAQGRSFVYTTNEGEVKVGFAQYGDTASE